MRIARHIGSGEEEVINRAATWARGWRDVSDMRITRKSKTVTQVAHFLRHSLAYTPSPPVAAAAAAAATISTDESGLGSRPPPLSPRLQRGQGEDSTRGSPECV